ncbi:MAG: DNA alkylation repair protein [Pseudomonadota bacterium]
MEPFKNVFNPATITHLANRLAAASGAFDHKRFVALATDNLDALELSERRDQVTDALETCLNLDFAAACQAMIATLRPEAPTENVQDFTPTEGVGGWMVMPMAGYVSRHGMDHLPVSFHALEAFTRRFTSEFGIRPFFDRFPEETLAKAHEWAESDSLHVRRLASEGSRPRLPWGMRLNRFVEDPTPLIPLLDKLKDDPTEYVRRSVANNLNDIAKDHPDLVAQLAGDWLHGASKNRKRLVTHACRSLVKAGHKPTLEALGYGEPEVDIGPLRLATPAITLGEALEFSLELRNSIDRSQALIVDFNLHLMKANGTLAPKTFKWKVFELGAGKSVTLTKRHPIKPVTTRVYCGGEQALELQINGRTFDRLPFTLSV